MTSSASSTAAVRRHLAMCPFPFTSHPASMLLLSRKIAALVPDVHISLFTTEPTATALSMSTEEGGSIRILRIGSGPTAVEPTHPLEITRFVEAAGEILRKAMAAAEEEVGVKIGCVVADAMMSFVCREIAEERGVKWVALWTPSAGALVAHFYTDQLRKGVGPEGCIEDATVDRYIPGFPPNISLRDLPHEILGEDYSFAMARILHLMPLHLPKAAAVAVNSFDTLEPAAADILSTRFGNKFLCAGPYTITMSSPGLQVRDLQSCLPWLDTHVAKPASVLYISFGSGLIPPPEAFSSVAEALEATKVPFLWSLPSRYECHLPQGFKERSEELGAGKFVTWAPQMSVLGHAAVGAHLTHCGWNAVMESVLSGVPLVCRPLAIADSPLNGRMAGSVWGIGVDVEGGRMTKAANVVALERVMRGEEGRRARDKINEIKRLAEEAALGSSAHNLSKFITIITG